MKEKRTLFALSAEAGHAPSAAAATPSNHMQASSWQCPAGLQITSYAQLH